MNTSTDAEEALRSTNEKENFHRLTRLLMCGGVSLLRETFDSFHSPTVLPLRLGDPAVKSQLKKAKLFKSERNCLYPSSCTFVKSTDFDITLTFKLLRAICNLTEPITGWDDLPNSTDHSLEAELVRIKYYRNSVYAHNQTMKITNSEFFKLWNEISEALLRIAGSISSELKDEWKKAIDEFLNGPLTTEEQRYVDELQLWYKNDMDVKDAVEKLGDQLQQVNMDVRDQLQQVNMDVRDQLQQGNMNVRDQLQQGNIDVTHQLQQLNQKLDYVTALICITVERFSQSGQPITLSHLPLTATSPAAAASANSCTVIVPINEEQPQFGGAEGTSRDHLEGDHQDSPTESYIWRVILSPAYNRLQSLLEYLVQLGVSVVSHRERSLLITVTCSSLQILECLWEDYSSSNLSKVVEQTLVTPDVLEQLGLSELKLKTTITEGEYNKCKEFFLTRDKITPSNKATSKPKNVDEIDDILEMSELMTSLKVSLKGCRTLDEMRVRLNEEMKRYTNGAIGNEPFSVLTEAKKEGEAKRATLYKFYMDTEVCLNRMDDKVRFILEQNIGNLKNKIALHKHNLEQKEYIVLVTGETSSGKSTLLNLILGEQILPRAVLSTTSTICELKYGTTPKLVAHLKEKNPQTGLAERTLWLDQPMEASQQSYLEQISSFVHLKDNREKGSDYKKIEVFWPHSLLKQGIVLVDSPGIGESQIMDDMVKEYLPEAFAFIYVINSANAGGIQQDRVVRLLELTRKVSLDQQTEFSPTRALFVCNKWDCIPPIEADAVKNHIIKKLKQCWPSLDPDSQIICMSSRIAMHVQGYGIITEGFVGLMNGIKSLVLKSIEARLHTQWRWLDYLLSRMVYLTKAFIRNSCYDRTEVTERLMLVTERLLKIEKQQSSINKDLQDHLEKKTQEAVSLLSENLKSPDVVRQFTSWTMDDVPDTGESWVMTKHYIQKAFRKRLHNVIAAWEEEQHVFADARTSLVKYFQQRFSFVEGQLRYLESSVVDFVADEAAFPESGLLSPETFSAAEKVIISVTSPIWVPIGLVALIVSAPVVGVMALMKKLKHGRNIKEYKKDKCGFLAKTSEEFLSVAAEEKSLRSYVEEQLKDSQVCLKQFVARIPELIQGDRLLCQQLRDEIRLKKEIEDFYQPLYERSLDLRSNMALFDIQEVRTMDISCDNLEWKDDRSSLLGRGKFGSVYRGKLKVRNGEQPVALKVKQDKLSSSSANAFLAETETLRNLPDYPFIQKFYGAALLKEGKEVRGILVLELCKENLRTHIFLNPENIPGVSTDPAAKTKVIRWAGNIANALEFLHERGIYHMNLKLENVLLSPEDVVKVADVGVASIGVSVAYTAPEVIRFSVYDRSNADIYSFGIIMWEMWYGKRAFFEEEELDASEVAKGKRPLHVEDNIRPPIGWQHLMERCWDGNAETRPTAAMCHNELTFLYREAVTSI